MDKHRKDSMALIFPSAVRLSGLVSWLTALFVTWTGGSLPAQQLYWTASNQGPGYSIRRIDPDGSNVEDVVSGLDTYLGGIAIDGTAGKVYWIQKGAPSTRVFRAALNGSDVELVFQTDERFGVIAIDPTGGTIYLAGFGILRMSLDGDNVESLADHGVVDLALDVANGKMYWIQGGGSPVWGADIWRADLDRGGAEVIHHDPFDSSTYALAVDSSGGRIYWATVDYRTDWAQVLRSANLDGTRIEELVRISPGLDDFPVYLDVDSVNRKIYWVNLEDRVFYRANMDGSDVEPIHEGAISERPYGLAVHQPAEPPRSMFRRGDANDDGAVNVSDAVYTLSWLFLGGASPRCIAAANTSSDTAVNIADPVLLLDHLFLGGAAPVDPFPGCGSSDLEGDAELGCEETACP